jgi:glycosyltransferase involved in cell wall biosynthesis
VFWVEDDWFSDPYMKQTACTRMELADLTVAVTPGLRDRILELYPNKLVIVLEEPIDVDRLDPGQAPIDPDRPSVIWSGRPRAFDKLLKLDNMLVRIYRDIPFRLRIITGSKKPDFPLSIPWEWLPYSREKEAERAAGAVAGLAPLTRTTYDSCKGNYKVKTYMALGVPPLTSPVGYNNHLIRHGQTGFLLDSEREWESALRGLLTDRSLARKVGEAARSHIVRRYSYMALMPTWAEALQDAFPGKLGSTHLSSARSESRHAGQASGHATLP